MNDQAIHRVKFEHCLPCVSATTSPPCAKGPRLGFGDFGDSQGPTDQFGSNKKYDLKWGLEQVRDVWTKSFRPDPVQVPSDDEPEAVEEESAGKEPLHHRKTILNGR